METTSATSSEPQGLTGDLADFSPSASSSDEPIFNEQLIKPNRVERTKTITITKKVQKIQEAYR